MLFNLLLESINNLSNVFRIAYIVKVCDRKDLDLHRLSQFTRSEVFKCVDEREISLPAEYVTETIVKIRPAIQFNPGSFGINVRDFY